jgi:phosphonate transport system substrate-binding protein
MKKLLTVAAALAVCFSTSSQAESAVKFGWPSELKFGVIPVEGTKDATLRYKTLVDYLSKTLGIPVKFSVGADYAAVIVAMGSKQVDIAEFGAASYIKAVDQSNAVAFVRANNVKGGTGYNSILVVKANSAIKTEADAKGKTFSFVDPNSTSGYLVPLVHFYNDLKSKPEEYFSKVLFAGSHEASILSVLNGKTDVGATNNLDYDTALEKGAIKKDDLRIIWTSKTIPVGPIAFRKDMPASLKVALKNAFLKFNDKAGLDEMNIKGYVVVGDADYNPTRDIEKLKADLLSKK